MNRKMILFTLGKLLTVEAVLLLFPAIVSLIYRESSLWSFLIVSSLSFFAGLVITALCRPQNRVIYAKEGFIIVALSWIVLSAVGALPFTLSGEVPHYIDALFETVSGFTTTGASVIPNVELLSHGMLFWRSFTHWIGGMGILVFVVAIMPNISDRSIHILRAEMTGTAVGKLVPRLKDTAKILYIIYICLTGVQVIFLLCGKMSLFDSLLHAFGTAGTGGFGIKIDSVGSYSPYLQWVITVFMALFGINFNLFYLLLIRRFRAAFCNGELLAYLGTIAVSVGLITWNISYLYPSFGTSLRHAAFQVSSIITTTGYSTVDFNLWPGLSKAILFLLMLVGGCAGSTAGGLKFSRAVLLFKMIRRELHRMIHPRSVGSVKMDGKGVESTTLHSVSVYFALYAVCFLSIFFLLSFEAYDMETNLSATAACFNNIGPGLGAVGPATSFAGYSPFSKILLSLAMLLGRLEIFPLLLTLSPATWTRKT